MLERRLSGFFLLLLFHAMAFGEINYLGELQWKHRVLLVFTTPSEKEAITDALVSDETAIADRDLAWFVMAGEGVATNHPVNISSPLSSELERRFGDSHGESTRIILIGKDGGVKATYKKLNLVEIHALIDSMPMRQAELRRRRE